MFSSLLCADERWLMIRKSIILQTIFPKMVVCSIFDTQSGTFFITLVYNTTKFFSVIIMKWVNIPRKQQNWSHSNSSFLLTFTFIELQLFIYNQLLNAEMFWNIGVTITNCTRCALGHFWTLTYLILRLTHVA